MASLAGGLAGNAGAGGAGGSMLKAHHAKGREISQIQVGKCGNAVGHEFWRDLCEEHKIATDTSEAMNGRYVGEEGAIHQEHLDVFFNEGNNG
eukprot:gene232-5_t